MTHFTTYSVHLYAQVAPRLRRADYDEVAELVDDAELCGLLELVTAMYLDRLGSKAARRMVVGVESELARELGGSDRPFTTRTQSELLPILRHFVDRLEAQERRGPGPRVVNGPAGGVS